MTSRHLTAAVATLFLVGCADMGLSFERNTECFSSLECGFGQQCSLGVCTYVPEFDLDVEVAPLPSSGFLLQPMQDIDLSSTEPLRVVVAEPIELSLSSPVEAEVCFTARETLRRPLSFCTQVTIAPGDETASGRLSVVRGVRDGRTGALVPLTYDVNAAPLQSSCCEVSAPAGACVAPVVQRGVVPTADSVYVLPLDPATEPVRIRGRVQVSEQDWTPIANLQVQVYDPAGGVRSLASQTDAEGAFCLAVVAPAPGERHELVLKLGPSDTRPTVEIPDIRVEETGELELGAVFIGDHGTPLLFAGSRLVDATGAPVQGATVTLAGEIRPRGSFQRTVLTDELGAFEAMLLRGSYTVTAVPPETSEAGPTEVAGIDLDPTGPLWPPEPLRIVAPPRPRLQGAVHAPTDPLAEPEGEEPIEPTPVAGVEVVAELLADDGAAVLRTFTAVTDETGTYRLPVDPGDYVLHFRTPPRSELPWSVGHSVRGVETDRSLQAVALEHPAVVAGRVLGERAGTGTEPLGGAQVEIFGRTRGGPPYRVAAGWTDEEGAFSTVLPQSLASGLEPSG